MGYVGWTWLGLMAVCIVIEALTLGLTTIWFAIGALAAWFACVLGLNLNVQIAVFLIISVASLIFTWPVAVKKLKVGKVKTNAESLIGECFKVESTIDNRNNEGTVNVRGQIWSARSIDDEVIQKDEFVCVKEIIGVKLIVQKNNGGK
jgi:membrane protein implicated in regulation of membrane protease activity